MNEMFERAICESFSAHPSTPLPLPAFAMRCLLSIMSVFLSHTHRGYQSDTGVEYSAWYVWEVVVTGHSSAVCNVVILTTSSVMLLNWTRYVVRWSED